MRKYWSVAIIMVFALAASYGCSGDKESAGEDTNLAKSGVVPEHKDIDSYRYVMEVEAPGQQKSRIEYLVAKDGMKMKFEQETGGKWETVSWFIKKGDSTWVIEPNSKTVMKMPTAQSGFGEHMVPKDLVFVPEWNTYLEEKKGAGVEELGDAEVAGVDTTKYKVDPGEGRAHMVVSVDDEDLIRKMEVFERDKNISTMTITEVEINPDTSDKDFAPPSGYTIQDLSNMPGMPR